MVHGRPPVDPDVEVGQAVRGGNEASTAKQGDGRREPMVPRKDYSANILSPGALQLPAGALSCIYLITYSLGRVWIEALRTDPLCLGALPPSCEGGLRIAQLMSLAMMAVGGFGLWWLYGRKRKLPDPGRPRSFA